MLAMAGRTLWSIRSDRRNTKRPYSDVNCASDCVPDLSLRRSMPVRFGKPQEVGGADDAENNANGKRELCATGIMNDGGRGKLIAVATSVQAAAAGG
jgi:hypothetical protein